MKIKLNLQIKGENIKMISTVSNKWTGDIDRPTDPLNTKLIHLVSTLIVLIYNGTCAFQYTEATFGNKDYTILDSL